MLLSQRSAEKQREGDAQPERLPPQLVDLGPVRVLVRKHAPEACFRRLLPIIKLWIVADRERLDGGLNRRDEQEAPQQQQRPCAL